MNTFSIRSLFYIWIVLRGLFPAIPPSTRSRSAWVVFSRRSWYSPRASGLPNIVHMVSVVCAPLKDRKVPFSAMHGTLYGRQTRYCIGARLRTHCTPFLSMGSHGRSTLPFWSVCSLKTPRRNLRRDDLTLVYTTPPGVAIISVELDAH
jgi:hypothetical protein